MDGNLQIGAELLYFISGLAFFSLGFSALLETRHSSEIQLGRQLRWLAAFGLIRCLVDWMDLVLLLGPPQPFREALVTSRTVALPISALLLVRFGIGLLSETGPLPAWMNFVPSVLLVPVALLIAYALIIALTNPPLDRAADIWSRYLLYLPGCILAGFGFVRQWRRLEGRGLGRAGRPMLGAALCFLLDGMADGLIVPEAPYGLAPWLNMNHLLETTGIPVQLWRLLPALAVTWFTIRTLGIFEAEHVHQLRNLEQERQKAEHETLQMQRTARQAAETWTNGLVSLSRQIADMEPVDGVLIELVTLTRRLLHGDTASLALWDATSSNLELKCYATREGVTSAPSMPIKNETILATVRSCRSTRYPDDLPEDHPPWICPVLNRELQAVVIVPLKLDGRAVGGMWVGRHDFPLFSKEDQTGLEHLADQAVIALQHAVMAARVQSLAVLEERGRIAREMHDSLSQILGYLNVETQTLEALVRQGNRETAIAELRKARRQIGQAQADVRENILSLRTTLSNEDGLLPALREYVQEFGVQTGIEAEFTAESCSPPPLSPLAEIQLVRIVQEALSNVRKHAHPAQVQVSVQVEGDCLHASIRDDGVGFSSVADHTRFGLQTMRERAESVGGTVIVQSEPGAGTSVDIRLPLVDQ